jgi:hypothetical protein
MRNFLMSVWPVDTVDPLQKHDIPLFTVLMRHLGGSKQHQ